MSKMVRCSKALGFEQPAGAVLNSSSRCLRSVLYLLDGVSASSGPAASTLVAVGVDDDGPTSVAVFLAGQRIELATIDSISSPKHLDAPGPLSS